MEPCDSVTRHTPIGAIASGNSRTVTIARNSSGRLLAPRYIPAISHLSMRWTSHSWRIPHSRQSSSPLCTVIPFGRFHLFPSVPTVSSNTVLSQTFLIENRSRFAMVTTYQHHNLPCSSVWSTLSTRHPAKIDRVRRAPSSVTMVAIAENTKLFALHFLSTHVLGPTRVAHRKPNSS